MFQDSAYLVHHRFGPRKFEKALESSISRKQAQSQSHLERADVSIPIHSIPPETIVPVPVEQISLDTPPKDKEGNQDELPNSLIKTTRPMALLVEDNPINLKLLVTFFQKMGHDFQTAINGAEALDIYRKANGRFDIICMDIQMPVMDGMEASIEIRKYEKQNGLPYVVIIALTALTSLEAKQAAMDSGVDRFLSKPISMKEIRKVVEEYWKPGPI